MTKILAITAITGLLMCGCQSGPDDAGLNTLSGQSAVKDTDIGQRVKCPVMGTEFTVTKNTPWLEYQGKVYYFCCGGCRQDFVIQPEKYIKNP